MAKADVIAEAQALGIEVSEENTVAEIQQMIKDKTSELIKKAEPETVKEPVKKAKHNHYEEWHVKISKNIAEKMKINRPCVKISEEQAEILNEGVLYGNNTYAVMYFKPE